MRTAILPAMEMCLVATLGVWALTVPIGIALTTKIATPIDPLKSLPITRFSMPEFWDLPELPNLPKFKVPLSSAHEVMAEESAITFRKTFPHPLEKEQPDDTSISGD